MTLAPKPGVLKPNEPVSNARWIVPAVACVVFGVATAVLVTLTAERSQAQTALVSAVGIAILLAGVLIGSEGIVGVAVVPLLLSALISGPGGSDATLGRSVLIGCALYAMAELGWESITDRVLHGRPTPIRRRRVEEVAIVLAVALVIGLTAAGASELAPDRTLVARGAAVTVGLALLVGLGRRIRPDMVK